MFRMEIAAESLRPFAANALPGLASVFGEVKAAGRIALARIRRTQEDSLTVAGIDRKVLGVQQRFGDVDFFPGLGAVRGAIEADAFRLKRLAGRRPPSTDDGEQRAVAMENHAIDAHIVRM